MILDEDPIYILDGRRTPIGTPFKGLKAFKASRLAAVVLDAVLEKIPAKADSVSEVILGNVVSAGTGQNLAREAVSLSKLPTTVPAFCVNNVCGSGLQAVILGAQKLMAEKVPFVVAGATESATHNPQLCYHDKTSPVESLQIDGLFCPIAQKTMGIICEEMARQHKISRASQDAYALESHRRACAAREAGAFNQEIVPVQNENDGVFFRDERPRANTSLEKLGRLPPAFGEAGTVTAGNASSAADGACAFLMASSEAVKTRRLVPMARIVGYVSIAVEPGRVFSEGTEAVRQCLKQCRLVLRDIDLFEITEAFAAQAVYVQDSLKIPPEKMNIYGGDVALGHPLGVAGARTLVTLIHALKRQGKKYGLDYVGFGAGGAIAIIVENVF